MAAKKSIPKKSAAHASPAQAPAPAARSRSGRHRTVRPSAPCSHGRAGAELSSAPARDRDELIFRLSSALALIETVSVALREFEDQPTLGAICMALNQAIVIVGRAHTDVEQYLERKYP